MDEKPVKFELESGQERSLETPTLLLHGSPRQEVGHFPFETLRWCNFCSFVMALHSLAIGACCFLSPQVSIAAGLTARRLNALKEDRSVRIFRRLLVRRLANSA
jgi:hypothetical protein